MFDFFKKMFGDKTPCADCDTIDTIVTSGDDEVTKNEEVSEVENVAEVTPEVVTQVTPEVVAQPTLKTFTEPTEIEEQAPIVAEVITETMSEPGIEAPIVTENIAETPLESEAIEITNETPAV